MGSLPSSGIGTFKRVMKVGAVLVALTTLVSIGCSGRTERLPPEDPDAAGTSGTGQAGESSGSDDEPWGGDSLTGEACNVTDPESCKSDEDRCCPGQSSATCVPITWRSCTGCGEPCELLTTDSCVDRRCTCGEGTPCSGLAKYCSEGRCVECFGDADCQGREGLGECVDGACRECDPVDGTGCSEESPACSDQGECVLCSEDAPCPGSLFCDFELGRCKACVEHSDCTDPSKPICFEFTEILTECWACENDEECAARDPERGQCTLNGTCVICDGTYGDGCDADEQCLDDGEGGYECRGCENDDECWDTMAPLCDAETGLCLPCNDPSIADPHGRCLNELFSGVCVTSGEYAGNCGPCDPGSHTGCSPQQPYCDPVDVLCKECLAPSDCPNGFDCTLDEECVGCVTDADCENNPSGGQCVAVTGGNACRSCDPGDNAGCSPPETCWGDVSPFYCSIP